MKTINYYTSDHTSIGSEKTGKFPHVLKFAFITIIAIVFSSCNDSEMAKQLNGSWDCDMEMKDDEGNPYTQNRTLTFNYLEDATGFGGNFTEKNITNLSGTEDDIELNCTVTSTINGKYEVIAGDLWLTYNLSSLDVSVSNVNYDLSDDADFFSALSYLGNALPSAMLGQEIVDKKELVKEIRRSCYQELYRNYESNNDDGNGACLEELKITNDAMSCKTADSGIVTLYRVQ